MAVSTLRKTKSVEQCILDTNREGTRLRKNLTTLDLTTFGIASVIGAGIFTLTASTAGDIAGPSVSIAYLLAAITCGLTALCYAELASTMPVAGSAYTFSYATFGELTAWIIGWDLILEFAMGAAVVAQGWSLYLQTELAYLVGPVRTTVRIGSATLDWGALLLVAALTTVIALGVKLSARVSQVITAIKVFVVLLVILVGISYVKAANYSPFVPSPATGEEGGQTGVDQTVFSLLTGGTSSTYGIYGMFAAASLVFFAFIGFDAVATMAEETRHPQRDVPRGILGSLAIVTVLYIGVTVVLTGMVSYTQLSTKADGTRATLATAFSDLGVIWAANVISIGALAGLTTVVLVSILGQVRIIFAMSRDGLLPTKLAHTGSRGTPLRATVGTGVLIALVAAFFPAERLEEMVNVGTLFAFLLVSGGVLILRRTRPDLPRGFRVPLVPLIPILAIVACLWLMINLTALTWLRFAVWIVVGLIVYATYGRSHSLLNHPQNLAPAEPTDKPTQDPPQALH